MKKIKLFLAAMAAMVTMGVNAQSWTAPTPSYSTEWATPTDGQTYYIYNVGAGTFLGGGRNWGTRVISTIDKIWAEGDATIAPAANVDYALPFTLKKNDDGTWYLIHKGTNKANKYMFYENGNTAFIDNNTSHANAKWNIVSDANGYRLDMPNKSGMYFGVHSTNLVSASLAYTWSDFGDTGADKWIYWQFVPESEVSSIKASAALFFARLALYNELVKAESEGVSTVDASAVYTNTNATSTELNSATTALRQARIDYRSSLASETNPQDLTDLFVVNPDFSTFDATGWTRTQTSVGNQQFGTGAMESWNNNNVSVLQTLTNLANGKYRVSCDMISGNDGRTAYVYAKGMTEVNGEHVNAQSSAGDYNTMSNEVAGKTISAYPVIVGDHTMTIGFKDPSGWVVVDNFKVIYYGPDLTALKEALQAQIDAVPALEGTTTTAAYNAAKNYADGIDMDALTTEAAISTASTELATRVNAATALQASYSRFKAIKNAALAISAAVVVPDVESATTTAAIDAAIPTLRANFLAELPNVTIPTDPGYIDVTAVMVDNAGVHTNTDYWTKEGTPNGGYSFGVCNYGECEFYNCNFKFYQTLALTPGTWEFGVTGFHRAGNHNTNFYAGVDKILIPGVESSVVNNMAQAQTYFNNGNGKVALKFLIETAGDVEIGIDNKDTETDKWTIFRDFTLKYYGAPDYSVYTARLAELANEAATVEGTVPAAAYTALNNVVTTNNTTHANKAEYIAAIEAVENAIATAKALQGAYAAYKSLSTAVQALYDVANYEELTTGAHNTLGTALSDAATEIETKTTVVDINAVAETLRAAGATYAGAANPTNGAKFNLTFMLTNPNLEGLPTWTGATGWYTDQPDGNSQVMTNNNATSEDGTKTAFYEYWMNPAKTNNLFALYQKVTLAEGTYNMTCYAFAQDDGTHINHPNGVYFFANDVQGSAVNNAKLSLQSIEFVNGSTQEVKIGLKTVTGNENFWMGIGYVELYKVPAKVVTIDEAVDYVAESAAAKVILNRTIKADTWNTFVVPFQLSEAELKAAFGDDVQVAEFSDGGENANAVTVKFNTMATPAIAPNKPVLLKTSTAGTSYTFEGRTIAEGEAKVAGTYVDFVGTYAASTTVKAGDYFISANKLYKSEGRTTLKGTRAYIDAKNTSAGVKLFIDDIETAIEAINGEGAEDGVIYNIAGQRVNKAQKGIYIQNGKKFVVR